jgi:hypothetical protein
VLVHFANTFQSFSNTLQVLQLYIMFVIRHRDVQIHSTSSVGMTDTVYKRIIRKCVQVYKYKLSITVEVAIVFFQFPNLVLVLTISVLIEVLM